MAVASRQNNKHKRDGNAPPNNNPRRGGAAWKSGPPNFAQSHQGNRGPPPPQGQQGFPMLPSPPNQGAPDRVIQNLETALNTNVVVFTRSGSRHGGVLASIDPDGFFVLKNHKDLSNPSTPSQESMRIPFSQLLNWQPGESTAPNGNGPAKPAFRTDAEISQRAAPRERELQAWTPDPHSAPPSAPFNTNGSGTINDETTFGPNTSGPWDQFAVNQQLYGVTTSFDEELYTTKLDRTRPDFKERERHATQIMNQIQNSSTNNSHIAEERNLVDDSGINEEDKYGAVIRGPGAYVPPGARPSGAPTPIRTDSNRSTNPGADAASSSDASKPTSNGADAKANTTAPPIVRATGPENNLVGTFRDFVTNEKQRLAQKKQQIVKKEKDSRIADLLKFSQDFKLNKPIPADLVPILAKDEKKQKEILERSAAEAQTPGARAIAPQSAQPQNVSPPAGTTQRAPLVFPPGKQEAASTRRPAAAASSVANAPPSTSTAKPSPSTTKAELAGGRGPTMVIQNIPPFRKRPDISANSSGNGTPVPPDGMPSPASPTASLNSSTSAAFKLNVKANSFRPSLKPTQGATSPPAIAGTSASKPKPEQKVEAPAQPNPFFGTRPIKKTTIHIKDDFNPFKHGKVPEAHTIAPAWPYAGKPYTKMFPSLPPVPPQPAPGPPTFDEDPSQAAARNTYGMMYTYAPYPYPGQHPQQQMLAMPPGAPPGGYMPSPFMQSMPFPPPPHQGNGPPSMYGPPMNGMPPSQGYLPPPPPGAYPPNGAGPRGSMPPTPIPQHAYAYHQSPQMSHAVPYPMMMGQPPPPPQGSAPPHPYDGSGGPPGPPGPGPMNVAH